MRSLFSRNIYFDYFFRFILIFIVLNILFNLIRIFFTNQDPFLSAYQDPTTDIPISWPISVFALRIPTFLLPIYESYTSFGINHYLQRNPIENSDILFAIIFALFFFLTYRFIYWFDEPRKIFLLGFFAIILSNSIQGIDNGLIYPVIGEPGDSGRVYYHDAKEIDDLLQYIRDYDTRQSNFELSIHSIVHPPGPVIIYYILHSLFSDSLISPLFLLFISLSIIFYLHSIIKINNSESTANFVCMFFVFLPSTQIYYLSSVDSLIALSFLATIYHFVTWINSRRQSDYFLCIVFLAVSAFLNFTTVILASIMFAYSFSYFDILPRQLQISDREKTIGKDIFSIFLPVGAIFLFIYLFFGYNYIEGFMAASEYENRHYSSGFLLIDYPVSFFATRLENIAELILFLGPVGTVFTYKALKSMDNDYNLFLKYGILFFLMIICTGAFRTGETARALMYFYPLIMITIANFVDESLDLDLSERKDILLVTFFQVYLMQLFGWYYW